MTTLLKTSAAGLALALSASNQSAAQETRELSERLQPLSYLLEVGEWRADPITFYDPETNEARGEGASTGYAEAILDGHAIRQGGALLEPFEISVVGWIFPVGENRYRYVTYDTSGNFHDHYGGFDEAGRLVLTSEPVAGRDGGEIMFRRIDTPLSEDAFEYELHMSRDGGESWTMINRQVNGRVVD